MEDGIVLFGHSLKGRPEEEWQLLGQHLTEVASLAVAFASAFQAFRSARILGGKHDDGKRAKEFQRRMRGDRIRVDHSTAGALHLREIWHSPEGDYLAKLFGYIIFGHHGGLPDYGSLSDPGTLEYRFSSKYTDLLPDWHRGTFDDVPSVKDVITELKPLMCFGMSNKPDAFAVSFMIRMLFSCLVDADYLDTERFCSPERHGYRRGSPSIAELRKRFDGYMMAKGFYSNLPNVLPSVDIADASYHGNVDDIHAVRGYMLHRCMDAACLAPGIFSITMPTGGGKTLASLAFALRHAQMHGLRRIILVVPYTSIIEQNADVFRDAIGEDAVLEHHSNFIPDDDDSVDGIDTSLAYRLATENWDATVVVTTSVQFFESLFAAHPSRCRKLHNIARSVVIFDEIQMIPIGLLECCVKAMSLLAEKYGTSIVLCTATQPALMKSSFLPMGFSEDMVRHIIPQEDMDVIFAVFRRTRCMHEGELSDEELARRIRSETSALCIVNSRARARRIFMLLGEDDGNFHLSALMTPNHRTSVLKTVRSRLAEGKPCRMISTSLVECGVDISFPSVWRELNGLDVIAQSAGRCNREGRLSFGVVHIFKCADDARTRIHPELSRKCGALERVQSRQDLFSPETVLQYFKELYRDSDKDHHRIFQRIQCDNQSTSLPLIFDFKWIEKQFRFIEDDTVSVVIENDDSKDLLDQVRSFEELDPSVYRKLQRCSVQVYRYEFNMLKNQGRIGDALRGFVNVLDGGAGYSASTGLDVSLENGLDFGSMML